MLKSHCFTACALRLYGSCLTRFAFKTSDINIDVTHPSSVSRLLLPTFSHDLKERLVDWMFEFLVIFLLRWPNLRFWSRCWKSWRTAVSLSCLFVRRSWNHLFLVVTWWLFLLWRRFHKVYGLFFNTIRFFHPAEFSDVESDFHAKVPAIFCRDVCKWVERQSEPFNLLGAFTFRPCTALKYTLNFLSFFFLCSGLLCKVSAGNDVACLTTNHLAALAKLEPRLVPLVLAFRYWARVSNKYTLLSINNTVINA